MSWAPQSPDLTGYAPQSPDLSAYKTKLTTNLDNNNPAPQWSPQSPDIGGLQNFTNPPQHYHQPSAFSLDTDWDHKPPQNFTPTSHHYPGNNFQQPTSNPSFYGGAPPMPGTRGQRFKEEDADWIPQSHPQELTSPQQYPPDTKAHLPQVTRKMDTRGVEVKTKFPTARIKRIMQADEDVGKVAQVTPVVMAKALELFMIRLITASSDIAKSRNSKRVQTAHMKTAVMSDEQFDNLREIMEKVPDAPQKKAGAESDSEDDAEGASAPKKRKKSAAGKGKKRKGSDDDF